MATSATAVQLETFLGWAAACSRVSGFVSRKAAHEQGVESTSDAAWGYSLGKAGLPAVPGGVLPADRRLGEDAAAWARGLDPQGNDYLTNLQAVADADAVTAATRGTAGSMVHAYQRAMADLATAKQGPGEWLGEVGQRVGRDVDVDEVRPFEGRRGACWLVKGRLADRFPVAFFLGTPPELTGVRVGGRVRVEGTVKAHGEYRGRKETTLTRVTLSAAK